MHHPRSRKLKVIELHTHYLKLSVFKLYPCSYYFNLIFIFLNFLTILIHVLRYIFHYGGPLIKRAIYEFWSVRQDH